MLIKRTERQARRGTLAAALATQSSGRLDRRAFLRRSGIMAGGLAAIGALPLTSVRKADAAGSNPGAGATVRKLSRGMYAFDLLNDTVLVAGTARFSVDPELLASMAVQGKEPKCAIVISVRQAYLHCAKALLRSRLWAPDYVQPKGTFPSISRMVGDQIGLSEDDKKAAEARTEVAYKEGLWAPMS